MTHTRPFVRPTHVPRRHSFWAVATASALIVLAGCWEQKSVAVYRVVPGMLALPGVQSLALGEIDGPGGAEVGHRVARALMELNQFDVLDWSSPFAPGVRGEGWADAHGGSWGSSDATVVGTVVEHALKPSFAWQSASGFDGEEVTTYARTLQLVVRGNFRVIDPKTGRLLGANTSEAVTALPTEYATFTGPPCEDSAFLASIFSNADADADALAQVAYAQLAQEFVEQVARTYEPATVMLWHDTARPESVKALGDAERGDWSSALAYYAAELLDAQLSHPKLLPQAHYNYGVALGYSGNYADGITELEASYALSRDTSTLQALLQVREFQHDAQHGLDAPYPGY